MDYISHAEFQEGQTRRRKRLSRLRLFAVIFGCCALAGMIVLTSIRMQRLREAEAQTQNARAARDRADDEADGPRFGSGIRLGR